MGERGFRGGENSHSSLSKPKSTLNCENHATSPLPVTPFSSTDASQDFTNPGSVCTQLHCCKRTHISSTDLKRFPYIYPWGNQAGGDTVTFRRDFKAVPCVPVDRIPCQSWMWVAESAGGRFTFSAAPSLFWSLEVACVGTLHCPSEGSCLQHPLPS